MFYFVVVVVVQWFSIFMIVKLEKTATELATGCLKTMKSCYICIKWQKRILLSNKIMGLCLCMTQLRGSEGDSAGVKESSFTLFFY